jgi:CrcB protein
VSVLVWLGVGLLGGLGAILRFRLDALVELHAGGEFPLGTLTVNLVGSFVLGILYGTGVGGDGLLLAGTATIGSFTTFSTWMFETERLMEDGDDALALVNVVVSLGAGLAVAVAGWAIGAAA